MDNKIIVDDFLQPLKDLQQAAIQADSAENSAGAAPQSEISLKEV